MLRSRESGAQPVAPSWRANSRASIVRPLGPKSAARVAAALDRDPVGTCMVAARFEIAGMDRDRLGGTFWGSAGEGGGLCFAGPNVIPLSDDRDGLWAIADALRAHGKRFASIMGRAEQVQPLWDRIGPWWGPAREIRDDQPLLVCSDAPVIRPDLRVEVVREHQIDQYFPAAVAMFTEEVGVDPTTGDGGHSYRARVLELVAAGRAFAVFDGSTVIYKAEVGSLTRRVALIQGVWVHPEWRGKGLAAPATAAVVRSIQAWGRLPSLYVNAYNIAGRATYARVGFHQVGTFASVLF
ncbi:MAG: GNAT family N-acetyltransferase [Nakamurella sp.]